MKLYILFGLVMFISLGVAFGYGDDPDFDIVRVGFFGGDNYNYEESSCTPNVINHMKRLKSSFVLGTMTEVEEFAKNIFGLRGFVQIENTWFNNATGNGDFDITGRYDRPLEFDLNKKYLFYIIKTINPYEYEEPFHIVDTVSSQDAINDIAVLNNLECQKEIKDIQELRKQLEYGKKTAMRFDMDDKSPASMAYVNEGTMELVVGIHQYNNIDRLRIEQGIKDAIGYDIPIKFGGAIVSEESKIIQSPLKQAKNLENNMDVKCREGLKLVFKSTDNSPACVKESTVPKLIQRGWAT